MTGEKVYIVLVNYRTPVDTAECLASLADLDYENRQVLLVDSASGDGSLDILAGFLDRRYGATPLRLDEEAVLEDSLVPPAPKDLGGGRPVFIQGRRNLGFARACNLAIRYALAQADFGFLWLLNNDTVVDRRALSALVQGMTTDPGLGIGGSVLRYYDRPDKVQAVGGGCFLPGLGLCVLLRGNAHRAALGRRVESGPSRGINYIMGASFLIRRKVLEEVGLLDEAFFLYAEELDYVRRSRDRGWRIFVRPDSFVFHKGGRSSAGKKNPLYWRHLTRSTVLFLRKHHHPLWLVTAVPAMVARAALSGRGPGAARAAASGVRAGLSYPVRGVKPNRARL